MDKFEKYKDIHNNINEYKHIWCLEGESWRSVKGFEEVYEVSDLGRVRSVDREIVDIRGITRIYKGAMIKQIVNPDGYYVVSLSSKNKNKACRVNRLVAEAFIYNEDKDNKDIVNHIDENRLNNLLNNLEWCDTRYNITYGTAKERQVSRLSKPVYQVDINTGLILNKFKSSAEAEEVTGVSRGSVNAVSKGFQKTGGGFKWVYVEDYVEGKDYRELPRSEVDYTSDRKVVKVLPNSNKIVETYNSAREADIANCKGKGATYRSLIDNSRMYKGYFYIYLDEYDENTIYGDEDSLEGGTSGKEVVQIDKDTNEVVGIYSSLAEASRLLGIRGGGISSVITGNRRTFKGYIWVPKTKYDDTFDYAGSLKESSLGNSRKIKVTNNEGYCEVFNSIAKGSRALNVPSWGINEALRGKYKENNNGWYKDYKWEYI